MSEAGIRAEIKSTLEAVSGIGAVHDYERYPRSLADFFLAMTAGSPAQVNGWVIHRESARAERATMGRGGQIERVHAFRITGFYQLDDADGSKVQNGAELGPNAGGLYVNLLDSNGKRTRFMTQALNELGLTNVQVVRSRVEDYRPEALFNSVVARAFATLAAMAADAGRLCAPGGRLLAMKGVFPEEELARLPMGYQVVDVYPLRVPRLAAERHLAHLIPAPAI